jgi:cyclase
MLAGADNVALNTAALRDPGLITTAALAYGASTVVVSIEAKRQPDGRYEAYTDCGRERTGRDVEGWAREAEARGAGEILITSIDREGTGGGFDLGLVDLVAQAVRVPVVACGGAGQTSDVVDLVTRCDVSGVAIASVLHYEVVARTPVERRAASLFSRISPASMTAVKQALHDAGCETRMPRRTEA